MAGPGPAPKRRRPAAAAGPPAGAAAAAGGYAGAGGGDDGNDDSDDDQNGPALLHGFRAAALAYRKEAATGSLPFKAGVPMRVHDAATHAISVHGSWVVPILEGIKRFETYHGGFRRCRISEQR
eukprot:gene2043-5060_t